MHDQDKNKTGTGPGSLKLVSRRHVLAGGAAVATLVSGAGSFLAGATAAAAETPGKGGRLRLGVTDSSTDETLDMTLATTLLAGVTAGAVYNNLVEVDHTNSPIPELAESWDVSDDATRWAFKLRQGVEFHNGKSLTAEDVVFSMNRHRGPDTKSANKAMFASVAAVKADDDRTVVFTLTEGNADFPFVLSDWRSPIYQSGTTDFDAGVGTGGYRLQGFEPGVRAELRRNPNYWKDGRAHVDEVEVLGLNDETARNSALLSGQVDVINAPSRKTFKKLKSTPGIQGIETKGFAHFTMPMRADTVPFDNIDVRLALKYALDREQLLRVVLSGHGAVGNDHPISPANRFFASDLEQRVYDPDKAKFHVKKSGLGKLVVGLSASPSSWGGANALDAVALFRESAAKAGIDIDIVQEPADGYWSNVWLKKGFCTSYWFGRESEDSTFSLTYAAGAPQNESFWTNDRFQELLLAARAELDESKRRDMYGEMQRILRDDGSSIIPLFNSDLMAANDKVRFGEVASNRQLDGLRIVERWWMA